MKLQSLLIFVVICAAGGGCDRKESSDTPTPPKPTFVSTTRVSSQPSTVATTHAATKPVVETPDRLEVSVHPELLLSGQHSVYDLKFDGIALATPADAFPANLVKLQNNAYGSESFIFLITDKGVIKEILVKGDRVVDALAIESIDDLERRFGKPDNVKSVDWLVVYEWTSRKIRISFDKRLSRIGNIVIFR